MIQWTCCFWIRGVVFLKMLWKVFLSLTVLVCVVIFYRFFSLDFHYTGGEKLGEPIVSPTGTYTAQAYTKEQEGKKYVWVNMTNTQEGNEEQTIYYSEAKSSFYMNWLPIEPNVEVIKEEIEILNFDMGGKNRNAKLIAGKDLYDEQGSVCTSFYARNYNCFDKESIIVRLTR